MSTLKFKTNINCSGCVNSISPHLNNEKGIQEWQVETTNPDKILSVITEDDSINSESVIELVQKAGFKISNLN